MDDDNDLLDAQTRDADAKMPPAIVTFEAYFFPNIFVIQYLFVLLMAMRLLDPVFCFIIIGALLLITGVWQIVFGLIRYFSDTNHKGWQRYAIWASINIGILLFFWATLGVSIFGATRFVLPVFLFFVIFPHVISWYYWYLALIDSERREEILNGQR